jgi:hypothetical protein
VNINKLYVAVGLVVALSFFLGQVAFADEADQATIVRFSEPIQIPGKVLPAGTYIFSLLDDSADPHMVQVFNADRTVLYATLQGIPTDRRSPTDHTVIALAEPGAGQPDVLLKWFYPGRESGEECIYPKQEEKKLAQDKHRTIVVHEPMPSDSDAMGAGN